MAAARRRKPLRKKAGKSVVVTAWGSSQVGLADGDDAALFLHIWSWSDTLALAGGMEGRRRGRKEGEKEGTKETRPATSKTMKSSFRRTIRTVAARDGERESDGVTDARRTDEITRMTNQTDGPDRWMDGADGWMDGWRAT